MREVSNEKIGTLRDIILDRADGEKKTLAAAARREADDWLIKETEKLQRETNLIIQDARKRAEDIRRRQILAAEREKSTDVLRLQNRILSDALGRLQDKLVHISGFHRGACRVFWQQQSPPSRHRQERCR